MFPCRGLIFNSDGGKKQKKPKKDESGDVARMSISAANAACTTIHITLYAYKHACMQYHADPDSLFLSLSPAPRLPLSLSLSLSVFLSLSLATGLHMTYDT